MEEKQTIFYANDLFIFEPSQKLFYAHEEFVYQFGNASESIKVLTSPVYLSFLKNQNETNVQKEENKLGNSMVEEIPESTEDGNNMSFDEKNTGIEPTDDNQNPEFLKHNFDLFLEVVELRQYSEELSLKEFISLFISRVDKDLYKVAAYFHFRKKGFEIESGCIFSFDFLLYKEGKQGVGLLNKIERSHSNFAVYIFNEDLKQKVTFLDLHRKDRIAHNYNKKLVVCNIKSKGSIIDEEGLGTTDTVVNSTLNKFIIIDTIYERAQLLSKK